MRKFKTLKHIMDIPAGSISIYAGKSEGVVFLRVDLFSPPLWAVPLEIAETFKEYFQEVSEKPKPFNEVPPMGKTTKPPFGIIPAKLFYEQRLKDLNDTLSRNCCTEHHVRVKWQKEIHLIENVLLEIL